MVPQPDVLTVYLIEDDDSVRRALTRLLRAAGMQPEAFSSVEDFLKVSSLSESSCIVADVRMPGASGLEMPERLSPSGRKVPLIVVTADDTDKTRSAAKRAGASAFFRKPVDDQALLDAIEWALNRRSSPGDLYNEDG